MAKMDAGGLSDVGETDARRRRGAEPRKRRSSDRKSHILQQVSAGKLGEDLHKIVAPESKRTESVHRGWGERQNFFNTDVCEQ